MAFPAPGGGIPDLRDFISQVCLVVFEGGVEITPSGGLIVGSRFLVTLRQVGLCGRRSCRVLGRSDRSQPPSALQLIHRASQKNGDLSAHDVVLTR